MRLELETPAGFSFRRTVLSHGWCSLPPFALDRERWLLSRVLATGGGAVWIRLRGTPSEGVVVETPGRHGKTVRDEVRRQTGRILGLDEDLTAFYALVGSHEGFSWIPETGAGRFLRAPTVYEDLVKLICTTNCSWSLTRTMIRRLVAALGTPAGNAADGVGPGGARGRGAPSPLQGGPQGAEPAPGVAKGFMLLDGGCGPDDLDREAARRAFPAPETMASVPRSFYRDEIRAGYRDAALHELACRVASGDLDPETWRRSRLPTSELKKEILEVRGVGPYAAENLLRLLGRHDGLALDSWCRNKFRLLHGRGRGSPDGRIARFYARFGDYRGLALWCDLTRDWIEAASPAGGAARSVM